ncbi:MAG: large conductance mechanosensitive channel protein MscL [Gammaproteobacteria bacterium]
MLKEFKEFAMRGNVMDMAIGIVLGGAFGKIVASFVGDVLMPVIGKIVGGVDFTTLYINLTSTGYDSLAAAEEAGAAVMKYGSFLQTIVDFLIVAFAIFLVVKGMNSARRKEEEPAAEPTTKDCPRCFLQVPVKATRCGFCTTDI